MVDESLNPQNKRYYLVDNTDPKAAGAIDIMDFKHRSYMLGLRGKDVDTSITVSDDKSTSLVLVAGADDAWRASVPWGNDPVAPVLAIYDKLMHDVVRTELETGNNWESLWHDDSEKPVGGWTKFKDIVNSTAKSLFGR